MAKCSAQLLYDPELVLDLGEGVFLWSNYLVFIFHPVYLSKRGKSHLPGISARVTPSLSSNILGNRLQNQNLTQGGDHW